MRWTGATSAALVIFTLAVLILVGCERQTGSEDERKEPSGRGREFELQEVVYDHQPPSQPPPVRMRVLIDASASMVGFRAVLPSLLAAVDQANSYSRGLYFTIDSKETCSFSQSEGIFGCQKRVTGAHVSKAAGYTNLDKAVSSTHDFELAVIFTDGVPAGRDQASDCVGAGVDAACVAEALSDVVRSSPGRGGQRGAWIVPVLAMYGGPYFTEQPIALRDFDRRAAEEAVRTGTGLNARITDPRTSSDGTLVFNYEGPRMLLALIIGEVDVARPFLQEFVAKGEFSGISQVLSPTDYKGGTSTLPVFEVFPAVIPPQLPSGCSQERDARGRLVGDPVVCTASAPNRFLLRCGARPESRATQRLIGPRTQGSLKLRTLAPVSLSSAPGAMTSNVSLAIDDAGAMSVRIGTVCRGNKRVVCGTKEAQVRLSTTPNFAAAAARLSAVEGANARYLHELATRTPARHPHRVYGLADLLENFYRRDLPQATEVFAALEFCQE